MAHLLAVMRVFAPILVIFAGAMLLPVAVSWTLSDGAASAYDEAVLITLATGAAVWLAGHRHRRELQLRDGFLLVSLVWFLLPAFGAIPLYLHLPELSWTDAYFEAVSGLTATGATVLKGLDRMPVSINLWRCEMHWLGGLGILVLAVAILPLLGVGGRQFYKAETPGPMKEDKLTPRIAETAKGLGLVYVTLTVACLLAFSWAGMGWMDALIHALSTVSLGGFSSLDTSLGHYDSPAIEGVAMVFALAAGVNFASHFLAWRQKSLRAYLHDGEIGLYALVLTGSCFGLAAYLWAEGVYPDYGQALRHASFNTISLATSLGFVTADYSQWPLFVPLWMLFLGSFVACSGSCGGGIKMMRAILLYRQVFRELVKAIHPQVVYPVKLGGTPVPSQVLIGVLAFAFLYMVSIASMTLVLAGSGLDAVTAFSAVVTCINNTGPGLGLVAPGSTFGVLNDFQTWVCAFAMLLGRLEIFSLLVLFSPAFWRR